MHICQQVVNRLNSRTHWWCDDKGFSQTAVVSATLSCSGECDDDACQQVQVFLRAWRNKTDSDKCFVVRYHGDDVMFQHCVGRSDFGLSVRFRGSLSGSSFYVCCHLAVSCRDHARVCLRCCFVFSVEMLEEEDGVKRGWLAPYLQDFERRVPPQHVQVLYVWGLSWVSLSSMHSVGYSERRNDQRLHVQIN